jgi:choline dehydrogenase-like flavoprotein
MPAQTDFDVIIIGSGAGGAPIAHELVKQQKSVLVLEKGPLFRTQSQTPDGLSDFKRDELYADGAEKRVTFPSAANVNSAFFSSHVEPDINDEPHIYRDTNGQDRVTIEGYTAQVVGGGTQIYGGVSLRFTQRDLTLQTFNAGRTDLAATDPAGEIEREARDWPLLYSELEKYYCKAEKLVGINGEQGNQLKPFTENDTYQQPLPPNAISRYAHDGMVYIGQGAGPGGSDVLPYRTPLAVITEDHLPSGRRMIPVPDGAKTSYVNRFGDPIGLKSSTWISLLAPLYDEPNLEIRANCIVTQLVSTGTRITDVRYLDPSGREQSVRGKIVVVACSAIESIRLLKLSSEPDPLGFGRLINQQNDLLGKYFLTHAFGGASSIMPDRSDKTRSLDADWATDYCATDDFLNAKHLWAGSVIYNNTSDQALPISLGRTHSAADLDTLWHGFANDFGLIGQGMVDFLDNDMGRGLSVSFMANQVPQKNNRIELHPTARDKWNRPVAYIIKSWHQHDKYLMDTLAAECANILRAGGNATHDYEVSGFGGVYNGENGIARIANHILGGARFGDDPGDSVLDPDCRVWGFENLYVTDGAFMPTSGGANPTLTIQANSFRVADKIGGRL